MNKCLAVCDVYVDQPPMGELRVANKDEYERRNYAIAVSNIGCKVVVAMNATSNPQEILCSKYNNISKTT